MRTARETQNHYTLQGAGEKRRPVRHGVTGRELKREDNSSRISQNNLKRMYNSSKVHSRIENSKNKKKLKRPALSLLPPPPLDNTETTQ